MPVIRQQAADEEELRYVPPPGAAVEPPPARRDADTTLLTTLLEGQAPPATRRPAPARAGAEQDAATAPEKPRREPRPRQAAPAPAPVAGAGGLSPGQQVFVEAGAFLLFGVTPYALDLSFTLLGLTRVALPPTVAGLLLGTLFHIFMSLGQRYFVFQRGPIRLLGALLLGINTVTNLYGIMPVIDAMFGADLLGSLPRDPAAWSRGVGGFIWGALRAGPGDTLNPPPWWPAMLWLTALCAGIAWWAEIVLSRFYLRLKAVIQRLMG